MPALSLQLFVFRVSYRLLGSSRTPYAVLLQTTAWPHHQVVIRLKQGWCCWRRTPPACLMQCLCLLLKVCATSSTSSSILLCLSITVTSFVTSFEALSHTPLDV